MKIRFTGEFEIPADVLAEQQVLDVFCASLGDGDIHDDFVSMEPDLLSIKFNLKFKEVRPRGRPKQKVKHGNEA